MLRSHSWRTAEEMEEIGAAFLRWSRHPDAVFLVLHGEVLARR